MIQVTVSRLLYHNSLLENSGSDVIPRQSVSPEVVNTSLRWPNDGTATGKAMRSMIQTPARRRTNKRRAEDRQRHHKRAHRFAGHYPSELRRCRVRNCRSLQRQFQRRKDLPHPFLLPTIFRFDGVSFRLLRGRFSWFCGGQCRVRCWKLHPHC